MKIEALVNKYTAFIFDFDGVIVDSLDVKTQAFGQLFEHLGLDVVEKVKQYHLQNGGVSRYEKFKYYYGQFLGRDISTHENAQLDQRYSSLVVEKVIQAKEIPGAENFLKVLKQNHKFCAVISATPEKEIRHIVEERGLGFYFKTIYGSPRSKKENLDLLLKENNLLPKDVVYFGDAKSDYEAAMQYEVNFIGVVFGGHELDDIHGIEKIRDFSS